MTVKLISTGSPFEKAFGYSRAVVKGPWCFVSGVTGYDYKTMTMPDDVAAQAENCFATIAWALGEGGFDMQDIVRVLYTVTDAALLLGVMADGVGPGIRGGRCTRGTPSR